MGFIKEETNLVNYTLFSTTDIDQYQEKKSTKNKHPKKRLSLYAVKSEKNESNHKQRKEICIVRGKCDIIDQCKEFLEKSPKERTKVIAKGKFFGCYQPMLRIIMLKAASNDLYAAYVLSFAQQECITT